jgi:nicotinate-nucleotide adenylyltransferase
VLRAREPEERFALLVGADAARDLTAWREAEALPELADLIVFRRGDRAVADVPRARAVDVPAIEISASTIRRRVREGRSIRYYVPEAVAQYIDDHRLYLSTEG